jgi:hypothetical protein
MHYAGFGRILVPHPPMINWLLRQGLAKDDRHTLNFIHEFGHLQTLPFAVLYTGLMLAMASISRHSGLIEIILVLISTHAAWEIAAEIFTIANGTSLYRKYYEDITVIPRVIFWILTGILAVTGWIITLS